MNSKQRVWEAVHHRQPDKTPFLAFWTSEVHDRVSKLYGKSGTELFVHLGHDVLVSSAGIWQRQWVDKDALLDNFGISWHWQDYGKGRYLEIKDYPLAGDVALDRYTLPDPLAMVDACGIDANLAAYGDTHWIVGGPVGTMFETAWMLRGLDQFMMDMALNPGYAHELIDRAMAFHLTIAKAFVQRGVDMIWTGDDFGAQHRLIMSPKMWRTFFKERYARFFAELKALNPDIIIAHHSDGCIYDIIPDFIEIGLDVLQAVQPQSMDPTLLKETYGDTLAYWGTMDVQGTFPYGTPADVAAEAQQRMDVVGKSGGLILAPAHGIQPDVPLENLRAFYETVRPELRDVYAEMRE